MTNNLPNTNQNQNYKQLYNGVFVQAVPIDQNVYDIVYGFFLERTNFKEAADSLTQTLLSLSYNNKVDPLAVLKEFDKATNESDFKKIMISVFNAGRYPSSKIGYNKDSTPNKWVVRNIYT